MYRTLGHHMECTAPGSSIHGILQARILGWTAFPFSRRPSCPRDRTQASCTTGGFLPSEPPGKPMRLSQSHKVSKRTSQQKTVISLSQYFLQIFFENFYGPNMVVCIHILRILQQPKQTNCLLLQEKGTTEDEMVGWHHCLNGHECEQALGVGDGQGGLECYSSWGSKELDTTE